MWLMFTLLLLHKLTHTHMPHYHRYGFGDVLPKNSCCCLFAFNSLDSCIFVYFVHSFPLLALEKWCICCTRISKLRPHSFQWRTNRNFAVAFSITLANSMNNVLFYCCRCVIVVMNVFYIKLLCSCFVCTTDRYIMLWLDRLLSG